MNNSSGFRLDISFLRALSVMAVVLFHYNFIWFQGGFIGVDIFFVISGYLMTRIILSGFDKNKFSVFEFYKKRVLRIFPALLAMVILFGMAVAFAIPTQFIAYSKSAYASSLFFSNIYYFLNNGYFDQLSQYNFLLHTWSLSVEWQFYMILPLLLLAFKKTYLSKKNIFKGVFIICTLLSLSAMLLHSSDNKSYSFYIFYTRAWEMLAGGLAFLYEKQFRTLPKMARRILLLISYSIIAYLTATTKGENWPSLLAVVPVVCTLVIISLNEELPVYKSKALRYLGDISYSLYLYHWPLYVASLFLGFTQIRYRLVFIALSFLMAICSYHFIEKKNYSKQLKPVLLASLLVFGFGLFFSKADANLYMSKSGTLANYSGNYKYSDAAKKQYNLGSKHLLYNQDYNNFNKSFLKIPNNGRKNVVLLGDSHAGMFAETMEKIAEKNNLNLIQITADATYPMIDSESPYKNCVQYFNFIFKEFFPKNQSKINLIILSSNYAGYNQLKLRTKIAFSEDYFKKMGEGPSILYLGQTQSFPIDFPTYYDMKNRYSITYKEEKNLAEKYLNINNFLKKELGNQYIDILLNPEKISIEQKTPYIYDQNHLTLHGTESHSNKIENALMNALNQKY